MKGGSESRWRIIQLLVDNPKAVLTIKELQNRFLVTPTTAKTDIMGLVSRGLVSEFAFNKVKKGYVRSERFEEVIKQLNA